jgi:hypothetical protein
MSRSIALRVSDIRAVFRLVGECRELGDDALAWQRHFLAGVARLTGAGAAVNTEGPSQWQPFRPTVIVDWCWENGFDLQIFYRIVEEYARRGIGFNPMFSAYLAALDQGVGPSLTRADLVSDAEWYRSSYYQHYQGASASTWMSPECKQSDVSVARLAWQETLS